LIRYSVLAKQNIKVENIVALKTMVQKDRVNIEKVEEPNEEVNVEDEADLLCLH
jgi:hypothetical protein